ncbi:proteophosphoglycan ppg4 [Rhodotorula toruloides]|uniref:Proteophosphoglycan ppg4 n=1 Tax=Rhodotorula toruloides TaxID=5286 RepID=A0A511K8Y2_RHOTO|nr:proteophosphoglycan ppg4 [Rhodotorula toruloides]
MPVELHIDTQAGSDLTIHPAALPADARPGDLVAIRPVLSTHSKGKAKDRPLLYKVEKNAGDADEAVGAGGGAGGTADPQVGVAGTVAAATTRRRGKSYVVVSATLAQSFSWVKNRIEVELSLIPAPPPRRICASHVELYFNNMYLSRPDSFSLTLALANKVLHSGQRVALPGSGARLRVGDMWSAGPDPQPSKSRRGASSSSSSAENARLDAAYVTEETKFVFRSEGGRAYIFVEVSEELWQFEEDGSMLLEKCDLFLQELFLHYSGKMSREAEDKRSKGIPTTHVVSVILYGRVIYDDEQDGEEERAPLSRLEDGTLYRDFYKVILDLTPSPPQSIIHKVALELRRWQSTALLRRRQDGTERLSGRLACAHESPILEATNLALNSFEEHWIDRDLQRTGQEVIVLTAGTSFYQVEKSLLRLTTERMLAHGIGLDLISLSKMPLHTVPLFQFRSPDPAASEVPLAAAAAAANDSAIAIPATASNAGGSTRPADSLSHVFSASHAGSPPSRSPALPTPRFPASNGTSAFRPSSLRQAHGFHSASVPSTSSAPPFRDPHAPDEQPPTATTRVVPMLRQVPNDQRDPLYFDPPPPPVTARATHHARLASASIGVVQPSSTASSAIPPASQLSSLSSMPPPPLPATPSSALPPASPAAPQPMAHLETSLYYAAPMFVFPHFFGTQIDKPFRIDRFMPRARCYELSVQGVTERVPIAIPLLQLDSLGGQKEGDSEDAEGFLTEMERRVQKRERYDAIALGARDPFEPIGGGGIEGAVGNGGRGGDGATRWAEVRESGATTGTSGTSEGGSKNESGWSSDGHDVGNLSSSSEVETSDASLRRASAVARHIEAEGSDECSGASTPVLSSKNSLGLGLPSVAIDDSLRSTSQLPDDGAASSRRGSVSTNSSAAARLSVDEDERGRRSSRDTTNGRKKSVVEASLGRSKTPVPKHRRDRSASIAASIRTVASGQSKADAAPSVPGSIRKASTPALIARLTGGGGATTTSSVPGSTTAPSTNVLHPRPGWLSLFGRSHTLSSAPASPAAQVAVARVDVQASLRSEDSPRLTNEATLVDAPVLEISSSSRRNSSRSRSDASSVLSEDKPRTQPISIGSKLGGATSGAGDANGHARQKSAAGGEDSATSGSVKEGGRMSSSLKAYDSAGAMRRAFGVSGGKISVAEKFNPSKPGKRSTGLADQARRWAGIVVMERRSMRLGVKWRSITRGACLPITTDYLPSADALQTQYSEFRYIVPTGSVTSSFLLRADHPKRSHSLTLVTELICQRLSQGFQICLPSNAEFATSKTLHDVLGDIQEGEVTAVYLSLATQIHRIWYDRRSQSVFVRILRRRRTWAKHPYEYKGLIWTVGRENYDMSRIAFPYPAMIDPVDWQHFDRLVAGVEKPDSQQVVRYRRTRLVLLPAAKVPDRDYIIGITKALQGGDVSDAAIRMQGFYALMETIESARWTPAGVEKMPLSIAHTTLDAPGWAIAEARRLQQANPASPISPTSASLPSLPPQPRQNWLSRMQGRTGAGKGDEPGTPPSERDIQLSSPALTTASKEIASALNKVDPTTSVSEAPSPNPDAADKASTKRPVVVMSRAVVLDLDPQKRSDRAERVLCHLDRSHNIQAAYHIELAWLTASGKIVDTTIQTWTRQMARYGLNLVEVSMRPVSLSHNPFQKPAMIRPVVLPVSPWSSGEEGSSSDEEGEASPFTRPPRQKKDALASILRHLDFILDLGADSTFPAAIEVQYSYRRTATLHSQYIHRSGTILVSIMEDEEGPLFAYAPNRIFTTHNPNLDRDEPVKRLKEACADADLLRRLYGEANE